MRRWRTGSIAETVKQRADRRGVRGPNHAADLHALSQQHERGPQLDPVRTTQRAPATILDPQMMDTGPLDQRRVDGGVRRLTVRAPIHAEFQQDRTGG